MTKDLQELEMRWVQSVNAIGDKILAGTRVDEDVVALLQIVWDGMKLALRVVDLLTRLGTEICGDSRMFSLSLCLGEFALMTIEGAETWELVYVPPFFVENTVFCGRRTGSKLDLPMLQRCGYVICPASSGVTPGGRLGGKSGLEVFYKEFFSLVDGIERQRKCREIGLIREELAARMAT